MPSAGTFSRICGILTQCVTEIIDLAGNGRVLDGLGQMLFRNLNVISRKVDFDRILIEIMFEICQNG